MRVGSCRIAQLGSAGPALKRTSRDSFKYLVAGSQRHGAAGGANQKDHNRDDCTKRARRDAGQDDKILAGRWKIEKGKWKLP